MEFGYYQTSDSTDQPFGSNFPLDFSTRQCVDIYGVVVNEETIRDTNIEYGKGVEKKEKCCFIFSSRSGGRNVSGTRIIYPNGSIDPWHVLGITNPTNVQDTEVIYIPGTAHCADMYPASSKDPSALTNARATIVKTLETWLYNKA